MRVWLVFLLLSFVLGGRNARRGKPDRAVLVVVGCLMVAVLLNSQRLV